MSKTNQTVPEYEKDVEVKTLTKSVTGIAQRNIELNISDEKTYSESAEILGQIKAIKKSVEVRRTYYTAPMNDLLNQVNTFFRNLVAPLNSIEDSITKKKRDYLTKVEEERRQQEEKNQKKVEKAIESGKPIPVMATVEVPKSVATTTGIKETSVDNWKADVTDKKAFIDYCIKTDTYELIEVNQVALNKMAKIWQDTKQVPGIRLYNEKSFRTTR